MKFHEKGWRHPLRGHFHFLQSIKTVLLIDTSSRISFDLECRDFIIIFQTSFWSISTADCTI